MTDLGISTSNSGGTLIVRGACTTDWDRLGGDDTRSRGSNDHRSYDRRYSYGDGDRMAIRRNEHAERESSAIYGGMRCVAVLLVTKKIVRRHSFLLAISLCHLSPLALVVSL